MSGIGRQAGKAATSSIMPVYLRQRGFRLGEPEGHVHGAVQVDGGGQGGAGLLSPTSLRIQGAEAPMAVGQEGAHPELFG